VSIYATLHEFKIEHPEGDGWVEVFVQAVPGFIGNPHYEHSGYEDPFDFLPPPLHDGCTQPLGDCYENESAIEDDIFRAVVFVCEPYSQKVGQRYVNPLFILTGREYEELSFGAVMQRVYDAVRDQLKLELCACPCPVHGTSEREE